VFARTDPGGPSRMLVSRLESCTAPECTCREVGLRAVVLDVGDDFKPDDLVREALRTRLTSADAMNAQLDIDLGSVVPDDFEGRVPLSDDWAAYAQSQVDGELLERLHDQWLRAKGAVSAPKTDWEPRDPSDLVGWNEAHPADRADLYLDDDNVFIAEELYCVRPGCGCNEAVVAFAPTTRGSSDIGAIRVQIRTLELVERNAKPDKTLLLDRLWKAFTARHRHLAERLARRNKQMTDLAAVHSQQRRPVTRSAERVGRNEPCPCGSGKKYKRCCALTSDSSP
jgi:hypothetical protein